MEELRRKRREYLRECNVPKPEWSDVEKEISKKISEKESSCLERLKDHYIKNGNFTRADYFLDCCIFARHTNGDMYEIEEALIKRYPNMKISTFKNSANPHTTMHDTYAVRIQPEHFM